jgi:hypothetical protein
MKRFVRRLAGVLVILLATGAVAYFIWRPGLEVKDGRHDLRKNALWLAHGWLGGDDWFIRHNKTNEFAKYRSLTNIAALADKLRRHGIQDVFPHLCPAEIEGQLPAVDAPQVERFLVSRRLGQP